MDRYGCACRIRAPAAGDHRQRMGAATLNKCLDLIGIIDQCNGVGEGNAPAIIVAVGKSISGIQ